jgi:xanthine dehydrogenase accessory factor
VSAAVELLIRAFDANQLCALATIINIDGRAPRRVGAQMAITQTESAGSLSGGCLDATIIEQTRERLLAGESFQLRFGVGSPFMDLQLPCGSNIELQVDCAIAPDTLQQIKNAYAQRQAYFLHWPSLNTPAQFSVERAKSDTQFPYYPKLRIVAAGKGEALIALAKLAVASDVEVLALSPEEQSLEVLKAQGIASRWLNGGAPNVSWDPFSAALTLFHDHDLEWPFLTHALQRKPLLIAAMGAPRARELRSALLREQGISDADIQRIESPFGLIERARDPQTLAVSMLAACMQRYRDRYFPEITSQA